VKRTWISALGLVFLAAACGGGTDAKTEVKETQKEAGSAKPGAAASPAGELQFDADIVNAEDAKAEAEKEITKDNADAEYEKLKKEIEGGG
jgi:hypothetical protein